MVVTGSSAGSVVVSRETLESTFSSTVRSTESVSVDDSADIVASSFALPTSSIWFKRIA